MNTHNEKRTTLEKQGAVYRTYTILKHMILCDPRKYSVALSAEDLFNNRTAFYKCISCDGTKLDGQGAKCQACKETGTRNVPNRGLIYKKFQKLPITLTEVQDNIDEARVMWLGKVIFKTLKNGKFTNRAEWENEDPDYLIRYLREAENHAADVAQRQPTFEAVRARIQEVRNELERLRGHQARAERHRRRHDGRASQVAPPAEVDVQPQPVAVDPPVCGACNNTGYILGGAQSCGFCGSYERIKAQSAQ